MPQLIDHHSFSSLLSLRWNCKRLQGGTLMFQKLWKTLFVAALLIFIAMSDAIADDGTAYESTDQPSVNAAETGVQELPDDTSAIASRTSGDPGFTYGAAAR